LQAKCILTIEGLVLATLSFLDFSFRNFLNEPPPSRRILKFARAIQNEKEHFSSFIIDVFSVC